MATPIIMPRQGQSVESCLLIEWKVKPGDTVKTGDSLAGIETDKAVFEIESPTEGTVLELFFEEGDDIPVLTTIAAVGTPGEDIADLRPAQQSDAASTPTPAVAEPCPSTDAPAPPPPATTAMPAAGSGRTSPRARKRAQHEGVDTSALAGTGPGGRVIERDVVNAAHARGRLSPAARSAAGADATKVPPTGSGPGGLVLARDLRPAPPATPESLTIPVKGIRKIIAERMRHSLSTTAQLTLNRSFDASALQTYREKLKKHGDVFGLKMVTLNDLIVFATVRTLRRYPELNAHFLGDRIEQFGYVHLGVAVDTPRGLMVPVVRHADRLSVFGLSQRIRPLARACVDGTVQPDDLTGGTFTITNLGALGIESFTPVLNAPEVAILGVGGVYLKPVSGPHGVQHVSAMNLSLTIDHQAVDGAPGARFLRDLALALENIELLISEDAAT